MVVLAKTRSMPLEETVSPADEPSEIGEDAPSGLFAPMIEVL